MYDICCIGHITSDKVVNTHTVMYMPGGTAYYFSCALSTLQTKYLLVTALADAEMHYVEQLREDGIEVLVQPSAHTVFFENIYAEDQDQRTQRVSQQADAFSQGIVQGVNAGIFHLGPLLAGDISTELIKTLSAKGRISLDVQGYLRRVENQQVYATGWAGMADALPHISILKADVAELQALTGCATVTEGVEALAAYGVKEIVITNGSKGSQIWHEGIFYDIPAYMPAVSVDATGCGDTYMAGYLFSRTRGKGIQQSGEFAAAMAGLKTATPGAFTGTLPDVENFLASHHANN